MYKFNEEKNLPEAFGDVFDEIDRVKDVGFLVISTPQGDKHEPFVREFMRAGYHVSQPISTGKTAIVWDDNQLDGFLKSGFSFEQAINPEI